MFGLKSTVLIGMFLLFPFIFKLLSKEEIYPAVILPAGQTVLNIKDGTIGTMYTDILALTEIGEVSLDIPQLFNPIPNLYTRYIYENNFGLGAFALSEDDNIIDISEVDDVPQIDEFKDWVVKKMEEQSIRMPISGLKLVSYGVEVSIKDGKELSRAKTNEKTIRLY